MEKLPLTSLTLIRLYIQVIGSEAVGGSSYSFQDLRAPVLSGSSTQAVEYADDFSALPHIDSIKKKLKTLFKLAFYMCLNPCFPVSVCICALL